MYKKSIFTYCANKNLTYLEQRKGISLIVLVITVIVLAILATTSIILINNSNLITQASESVFKNDVGVIKDKINMEKINELINKLPADYSSAVLDKYKSVLKVDENGELIYIGEETSPQKTWSVNMGIKIVGAKAVSHFERLKELEELAVSYYDAGNTTFSSNALTAQYIRKNRYTGSNWEMFAGKIATGFSTYVESNKTQTLFGTNDVFVDPVTGYDIDFVHQMATLNAYFYEDPDISDAYTGWAGDLCTVLVQVQNYRDSGSYTEDEALAYAKSLIGSTGAGSTMGISDLLADVDAANINDLLSNGGSLSDTMYSYYFGNGENTCNNRFSLFKKHMEELYQSDLIAKYEGFDKAFIVAIALLGGDTDSDHVFREFYAYHLIGWDVYPTITVTSKKITAQAFADYINSNIEGEM